MTVFEIILIALVLIAADVVFARALCLVLFVAALPVAAIATVVGAIAFGAHHVYTRLRANRS